MSSALAHHYFGSKEAMFLAAMRHVMSLYGAEMRGLIGLKAKVVTADALPCNRRTAAPSTSPDAILPKGSSRSNCSAQDGVTTFFSALSIT